MTTRNSTVGIDLGTTFSSVAWVTPSGVVEVVGNSSGDLKTRSLVSLAGDTPVVGRPAENDLVLAPERTIQCFKRQMDTASEQGDPLPLATDAHGREWNPIHLSACILKELKAAAETLFGRPVTQAVVSHPAYFGETGRQNTRAAALIAGFEEVRLVEEPVVAATHYGLEKNESGVIVVVDYGGGTLDLTAIERADRIQVIAIEGDAELGGTNHDEAIHQVLIECLAVEGVDVSPESDLPAWYRNLAQAQQAKEMLAYREPVTAVAEASGTRVPVEITRETMRQRCADLELRFRGCCERLIGDLGDRRNEVHKVLLVGGSTRLPYVPEVVEEIFGLEPARDTDPDLVVAKGAAVVAASEFAGSDQAICLGGHRYLPSDIQTQTVAAHSLCVAAVKGTDQADHREYNTPLITAGTPLPAESRETFSPVDPNAQQVTVKVLEGEPGAPSDTANLLREFDVPVQPGDTAGHPVTVTMAYDKEGLLKIKAVDQRLNEPRSIEFSHRAGLTDEEIEKARDQLEATGTEGSGRDPSPEGRTL